MSEPTTFTLKLAFKRNLQMNIIQDNDILYEVFKTLACSIYRRWFSGFVTIAWATWPTMCTLFGTRTNGESGRPMGASRPFWRRLFCVTANWRWRSEKNAMSSLFFTFATKQSRPPRKMTLFTGTKKTRHGAGQLALKWCKASALGRLFLGTNISRESSEFSFYSKKHRYIVFDVYEFASIVTVPEIDRCIFASQ